VFSNVFRFQATSRSSMWVCVCVWFAARSRFCAVLLCTFFVFVVLLFHNSTLCNFQILELLCFCTLLQSFAILCNFQIWKQDFAHMFLSEARVLCVSTF
jgi:hypothetical protein